MYSSPLRPDFSSTAAVAGRLPATPRVLLCVSNPTVRTAIEQAAGQARFQGRDMPADRGLRRRAFLRGTAEVAQARRALEGQ